MRVKINGKVFDVVTIQEFASECGRETNTIRRYEQRGILPQANLRTQTKFINDKAYAGKRLYTKTLVTKIANIFLSVTQGTPITGEQKRLIAVAFQEEKQEIYGS